MKYLIEKIFIILFTGVMLLTPYRLKDPHVKAAVAFAPNEVINAVNNVRNVQGLAGLTENAQLDNSASRKAQDMCARDYWAHGDWKSFITYKYQNAAENLAYGYTGLQFVVKGWVESPEHYANIIGDYTETGIGEIVCPSYHGKIDQLIIVQHFGSPLVSPTPTQPITNPTPKKCEQ